jgi:hypothetical protein
MTDQPTPKPTPTRRTARPSTAAAKVDPTPTAKRRAGAAPGAAKPAAKAADPRPLAAKAAPAIRRGTAATSSTSANGNGHDASATVPGTVAVLARDGNPIQAETPESPAAGDIELSRGAIGRIEANDVVVTQGLVGAARAERVSVQMGALGFALTGNLSVEQGMARTVVAREAHFEQSAAQTVIAQNVRMERGSNAFLVIAQRVDGEVRAILDWRAAVAFGVAIGVVLSLFRRGGRSGRRG